MTEELQYVMVERDKEATLENNLLPAPVLLSAGEANFTNDQLKEFGSTQIYLPLKKDSSDDKS